LFKKYFLPINLSCIPIFLEEYKPKIILQLFISNPKPLILEIYYPFILDKNIYLQIFLPGEEKQIDKILLISLTIAATFNKVAL
tara:strand:- start:741 stop:992 length:252 start_codon:yes stop_codon:yes gene_type:complete